MKAQKDPPERRRRGWVDALEEELEAVAGVE